MEPLDFAALPKSAPLLIDSAPIISPSLDGHFRLAPLFQPLFKTHAARALCLAVTTLTIADGAGNQWRGPRACALALLGYYR
jgi:hypothetical protein